MRCVRISNNRYINDVNDHKSALLVKINLRNKMDDDMQLVCVENLAYNLKCICCIHRKNDSKPQAMFSADRLEVKEAR